MYLVTWFRLYPKSVHVVDFLPVYPFHRRLLVFTSFHGIGKPLDNGRLVAKGQTFV